MSSFSTYLQLGFEHISDVSGYDHILFIVALCAIYRPRQWKQVLILVTAFTLGHSVTLALAALGIIAFPAEIIEFLIPVTIFATALYNTTVKDFKKKKALRVNYAMALFFGLIHGMGFSNFFRALLGKTASIALPLLAFNLGLEVGQLLIVAAIMAVSFVVLSVFRAPQREWALFVSGAAAGLSLILMAETKFW